MVASEFPNDFIVIVFDRKQLPRSSAFTQLPVPRGHSRPELLGSKKLFSHIVMTLEYHSGSFQLVVEEPVLVQKMDGTFAPRRMFSWTLRT